MNNVENIQPTMTTEDIQLVKDTLNITKSEDAKYIESLPSNNGILETLNNKLENDIQDALVSIDPNTGAMSAFEKTLDSKLSELLDIKIEDLYNIPKSSSEIPYDEELIKSNAADHGMKDNDILALLPIIDKYRQGQKLNWYNEMPKNIKDMIDKECFEVNNSSLATKKLFATELILGLIRDAGIDKIAIDLQQATEKAFDISGIMKMTLDYQSTLLEQKFTETAEKLESEGNEEKAKVIRNVTDAYRQSYTLSKFIETAKVGKLRVKDFDLKKYKRFIEEFNYKYEKDTPFVINDLSMIAPVLKRHFTNFETDQIIKFVIAFCKFCSNLDASNVVDHTFMSYTIMNILNLDLVIGDQEENAFINELTENITTAIKTINNI